MTNKTVAINSLVTIRKQKVNVSQTIVIGTNSNKMFKITDVFYFSKVLIGESHYTHVFYNFFEVFIDSNSIITYLILLFMCIVQCKVTCT